MEIKAVIIKSPKNIDIFPIKVDELKYIIVRKRLELERTRIIQFFKKWKLEGKIKSIFKPRSKICQEEINNLLSARKVIEESIFKIKEIYYKS